MKTGYLERIEKIRKSREVKAAAAVAAKRRESELALKAVTAVEENLASQSAALQQKDSKLYASAVGRPINERELKVISQRMESGRYQIGQLRLKLDKTREVASKAKGEFEASRLEYAEIIRSCRKLEKVKQHLDMQAAIEEIHREEFSAE